MVKGYLTASLRAVLALIGTAGIMVLAGCGGGSGAPNNPYTPPPTPIPTLTVLPGSLTVYPGTPSTVTISGGVSPYRAFTSDSTALPIATSVSGDTVVLAANQVTTTTPVTLTIQDSAATTVTSSVQVLPAPLLPTGITVTSNPNPACAVADNTLCSGSTGTAQVKVTGIGGVGIAGRAVRFDVVQGSYSIVSTNPAQPLVSTLTTTTDVNGNARVVLSVPADTPTQSGIVRATDLTSGNQVTGTFVIQQITVGGQTLSVLPQGTTTINGPDSTHCSSGVSVTNYIFGGTPPYQVGVNFPGAVTLSGTPVTKSGGAFVTTTNGTCFVNLTYVITDATGFTIPTGSYPLVTNQFGSGSAPVTPTALVVTPGAIAKVNCVPANTFQFIGTGGTGPYSAVITSTTSSTSPTLAPQTGINPGQAVVVSGISSPAQTTITLFDASSPRQSGTVTIDCSGTTPPPTPSALVVAPPSFNFGATTCVNQTANFVVTGGTAPYTVFFASPRPGATIAPTTLASAGQGFAVTGLTNGVLTTNVSVVDSSSPQLQTIATITCPTTSTPPTLTVQPLGNTTFTGPDNQHCSTGQSVSNFITGGVPPYQVSVNIPGAVTLSGVPVTTNGGAFVTTTNGTCFTGLTYVITDATGTTIPNGQYPTVTNQLGTNPPVPALVLAPGNYNYSATTCTAQLSNFVITGGTPPYNVSFATARPGATITPTTVNASGQGFTVAGLTNGITTTTVNVTDSGNPKLSQSGTITCPVAAVPLSVTAGFDYTATSCIGQTSNFVITGGTPPYTVAFPTPPNAGALITPTTVAASGGGFAVTGLRNTSSVPNPGQGLVNLTVTDASGIPNVIIRTIACP